MLLESRFIERCASQAWERMGLKASSLPLRTERPSRRLMLLQRMDRDLQYERIYQLSDALTLRQVRDLAGISFNNPLTVEPYHPPHQGTIEKNAHYLTLADLLLEWAYPPCRRCGPCAQPCWWSRYVLSKSCLCQRPDVS